MMEKDTRDIKPSRSINLKPLAACFTEISDISISFTFSYGVERGTAGTFGIFLNIMCIMILDLVKREI